jgi:multiple antibiotic resistance protein
MLTDLLASIVVLYVVVDPIGNIPLFMAVTSKLDATRRRKVLMTSVAVAATILALFAVFGISFLSYFGVGIGDFMIASGLVLTAFSLYYLLRPYEQGAVSEGVEIAVVPLAVPFLAGPASISYVLVVSSHVGPLLALVVVAAASFLTLITLMASSLLTRLLGVLGIRVLEKIMLILSVAIGISLVRRGILMWIA